MNKLDRVGADFENCVTMMTERLRANPVPVQFPIGLGESFEGVVDLVSMKAVRFDEDSLGAVVSETDVPPALWAEAEVRRQHMIEQVVEADEVIAEKFVHGETLTNDEIIMAIRKATIHFKIVPVFCGTALRNVGVQLLLDGIVRYLPSPLDVPPMMGTNPFTHKPEEREPDDSKPAAALAFKIATDPYVGRLTYLRVYSGTIKKGEQLLNPRTGKKERIGRILLMHANKQEDLTETLAGEIVAVVGPKHTSTGDTLCDIKRPIVLERMTFPEPVVSVAIEPKTKADDDKLSETLARLAEEDPTFVTKTNPDTGQTIISGHGRAAPRHPHGPHAARVRGQGQRREADGRVPRDHHRDRRGAGPVHPPERRQGPVRRRDDPRGAALPRADSSS